jgi:hypothetical protein
VANANNPGNNAKSHYADVGDIPFFRARTIKISAIKEFACGLFHLHID